MTTAAALGAHPFLSGSASQTLDAIAAFTERIAFSEGAFVIREGEPADSLLLIERGQVSLEIHAAGAGTTQLETVTAGGVVGLAWLFPPSTWHLDGRATSPDDALRIDSSKLIALMGADHDVGYLVAMRLLGSAYDRLCRVRLQRLDVFARKRS